MSRDRFGRATVPRFLEPGAESCEFCARAFHVEVGYHCVDCDRPICPVCVVTVHERSAVVCPECPDERSARRS